MAEKILVVDDDLDTLRLVGLMLERQGYEIVAASNGNQALTLARDELPDLILLDLMMPDIDGLEVSRQLRASPETQDIPIIMFTAKTKLEDKLEGYDAGADDYLVKPIQPRELTAHVKAVLGRAKKGRAVPATAASTQRGYMIGVTAVRGGLGVSSLALNLGIVLRRASKEEVIVADFRSGYGTIGMELGYLRSQGLNRLLRLNLPDINERTVETELVTHSSRVRFLLASPQPQDAMYVNKVEHFEAIARQLVFLARYIILDLPPSLTPTNDKVFPHCDEIFVVLEPVPHNISQTQMLIEALVEKGIAEGRITLVLYNRVRSGLQLSIRQVQEEFGREISLIFTPAPELAYQASINNVPMVIQQPDSITTQQFIKLAERVVTRSG